MMKISQCYTQLKQLLNIYDKAISFNTKLSLYLPVHIKNNMLECINLDKMNNIIKETHQFVKDNKNNKLIMVGTVTWVDFWHKQINKSNTDNIELLRKLILLYNFEDYYLDEHKELWLEIIHQLLKARNIVCDYISTLELLSKEDWEVGV